MFRTILTYARRYQYEPDRWPHGYEDLDPRIFRKLKRAAIDAEDGGDNLTGDDVPAPGAPEPPVHTELMWRGA